MSVKSKFYIAFIFNGSFHIKDEEECQMPHGDLVDDDVRRLNYTPAR